MPYSNPSSPQPLPVHSIGRPNHRRSYSYNHNANSVRGPMFSAERGPGTFTPMGALPRRQKSTTNASTAPPLAQSPRGKTKFSFKSSSSSGSSSDDSSDETMPLNNITPPLVLKQNHSFGLTLNTNLQRVAHTNGLGPLTLKGTLPNNSTGIQRSGSPVPFPRTSNSPLASPLPADSPSLRPAYSRTSSSPIILSNGKPLKSSLKSSNSSPVISSHPHLHPHAAHEHSGRPLHLRAQSSPALSPTSASNMTMPNLPHHPASITDVLASSSSIASSPSSDYYSGEEENYRPSTPKAVHFPTEPTEIASVRLFSKRARPASVSLPSLYQNLNGTDGADTETGSESETGIKWGMTPSSGMTGYPFPRSPLSNSHNGNANNSDIKYALDPESTSSMNPSVPGEVRLEGLWLVHDCDSSSISGASGSINCPEIIAKGPSSGIQLHGTLLLQNLAYVKAPAVRFTLDNWQTTSEVSAKWVECINVIPEHAAGIDPTFSTRLNGIDTNPSAQPTHDRFSFTIGLDDYALGSSLASRTLWLVARYTAPGVGEWWDNNLGHNYRVQFKQEKIGEKQEKRERSLSAPAAIPETSTVRFPSVVEAPAGQSATNQSAPKAEEIAASQSAPAPNLEHAEAIATATTNVLSKLNLKNYASPTTPRKRLPSFSSGSPDVPIVSVSSPESSIETDNMPTVTPAGAAPFAGSAAAARLASTLSRFGSVANSSNDSVKLYWPWGKKSESPESSSPVKTDVEPIKEETVQIAQEEEDIPSMSSSISSSASDTTSPQPSLSVDLGDDDDAEDLLSPLSPLDGVSPFSRNDLHSPEPTPKASEFQVPPSTANPDDSLYQAFVQQWCFAQGPVVVR